MRLVHLADLHLGYRQYQRCTPAGINQREADVAATLQRTITRVIECSPDLVVVAGDIFHVVRPSNPAILHAFRMFSRLRNELPDVPVVMISGNHDAPRTQETGCILRLFREIGVHVADSEPLTFEFRKLDLSVTAVPAILGQQVPPLLPSGGFTHNVLVRHGLLSGMIPHSMMSAERIQSEIRPEDLHADKWSYIALGDYHVYRRVAPHAYYCGSIDYTSVNIWGEVREEAEAGIKGKGFIVHDLDTHRHKFESVDVAREVLDLEPIDASGMTAKQLDQQIYFRVESVPGGIDDKIVRLLVFNAPRHLVRELDHNALRDYKRRAVHFHLDTRRPDPARRRVGEGAPGKRTTLPDIVAAHLESRQLPAGVRREPFVAQGMDYLRRADDALTAAMPLVEN